MLSQKQKIRANRVPHTILDNWFVDALVSFEDKTQAHAIKTVAMKRNK